jgi:hypothetical protein
MTVECCRHCSWTGPARVYDLVWSREWVCPRCVRVSPSRTDCSRALIGRLRATADSALDAARAARARALASSLASVIDA